MKKSVALAVIENDLVAGGTQQFELGLSASEGVMNAGADSLSQSKWVRKAISESGPPLVIVGGVAKIDAREAAP